MMEIRDSSSPAGPITAVRQPSPNFSRMAARVSRVSRPHTLVASSRRASPSSITSATGFSLAPVTRTASKPALQRATPSQAPAIERQKVPVRGERKANAVLEAVGIPVPVRSPGAMARAFSGPRGSAPLGMAS
jgi:hypothetical protein